MKRRGVAALTGFGANAHEYMSGESTGNKALDEKINAASKEMFELFLKKEFSYCDAGMDEHNQVILGVEPTYMYEKLKIIVISPEKEKSYIQTGYAWGAYGSDIASTKRLYKDFKYKTKFTRFVDKWHKEIYTESSSDERTISN